MASVYDLKPAFQTLLRPLCQALRRAKVTPNIVTLLALFLSCLMGALIVLNAEQRWPLFALPAFLFVRMALNAIDGMMAREFNLSSKLGAVLNELGDVISDTVLYLPLAAIPAIPTWPIVAIVVLAVISEMASVVGVQVGGTRRYDGPMGKSDRAFALGLLTFLMGFNVVPHTWIPMLLWTVAGLLLLTILNRCAKIMRDNGGTIS